MEGATSIALLTVSTDLMMDKCVCNVSPIVLINDRLCIPSNVRPSRPSRPISSNTHCGIGTLLDILSIANNYKIYQTPVLFELRLNNNNISHLYDSKFGQPIAANFNAHNLANDR